MHGTCYVYLTHYRILLRRKAYVVGPLFDELHETEAKQNKLPKNAIMCT